MAVSVSIPQADTLSQEVKLARNPVHDHFKYLVDKKIGQCESCGIKIKGKNSTTL